MSKVKVKKVKVQIGAKDEGIAEMFNQMLGTGSVNMSIAYPRYVRVRDLCTQVVKLFELVATCPTMRKFLQANDQIIEFCKQGRADIDKIWHMDFTEYEWNLSLVEEPLQVSFTENYEQMKKCDMIKTFIIMCNNLVPFRKHFEDEANFRHQFITSMPGTEWCPFPFTTLNLKDVMCMQGLGKNTILFFMTVLHKAYKFSRSVYDELQQPDVDVDQFVDVIMSNIDQVQKQPELHRCKDAFARIRDSVKLLKGNFGEYYRDFIETKDSTIMMQNFILDVSKSTAADARVAMQFKHIISYYQKIASQQTQNPKVKMLFDKVNESFRQLEKNASNLKNDSIIDETVPINTDDATPHDDSDMIFASNKAKSIYELQTEMASEVIKESEVTDPETILDVKSGKQFIEIEPRVMIELRPGKKSTKK